NSKLNVEEEEAACVAVIALQRYLCDPSEGQPCESYSYDVTVTDGVWRAKCYLHPSLNHLVHTNSLRTGSDIIIAQCSFVYNERRLGHGYISIEKLRCSSGESSLLSHIRDVRTLPVLVKSGMERSTLLQSDVPLELNRKHYLSLWNNEYPEGDVWTSAPPSSRDPVLDVNRISLINNLESAFRSTCKPLPLLVKILQKSRLRYYGKIGSKIDFPYQAYFEVADQSGIMSLVLWNELCPQFYNSLNVGTVLYIQNYALKQSYSNRSRPQMDHYGIKMFTSIEICLNARNPTSIITVVPPKNVQPQWSLPDVSYRFATRSDVETFPNNSVCDIIGLVTFVGRVERVKRKGNTGPEKYWSFRWVHAVDGTSEHPFVLELFSSSQPEIFGNIWPMTYLVCTQMRVCQVEGSLPYLTSSCETEMFITGYHKGQPYKNDPTVQNLIQRNKTLKDNVVLQKAYIGGHYCYPHAPCTFTQPVGETSDQVPLVAASDLKKELETLQYREHKKLAIQGQITTVRYVEKSSVSEPQGLGAKEVPGVSTGDQDVCNASLSVNSASASSEQTPVKRKRTIKTRNTEQSSASSVPAKRGARNTEVEREPQENEGDPGTLEQSPQPQNEGLNLLSWESCGWSRQCQELSVHLHHGTLHQDSISRRFTLEEKNALLRWSNLHPMRWTPEQSADTLPTTVCAGYYQVTILGINKQIAVDAVFLPIERSGEHRAVGLPPGRHDDTMLSCLSSGFVCPLSGVPSSRSEVAHYRPEDIMATASELEDTHLVCVLDICHLGGEEVEVLISKVYKVTEVSVK
ncbi:uncharacterized protein CXorf57-like, partial [Hippocampus comes]|uniref:uncharacterized protein CXorf57-like n=1 Tax=Hippocampus comes TaxID=109280 RepID=UPI00094E3AF1